MKKRNGMARPAAVKRLRRLVKGIIIQWEDDSPESESKFILNQRISHRNPVMNIDANNCFRGMGKWLTEEQPFRWLVTITGVYVMPNGNETHEERQLEAFCVIADISELALDQIAEIRRYGCDDFFKTIRFNLECIGVTSK